MALKNTLRRMCCMNQGNISGLVIASQKGDIVFASGDGNEPEVQALFADRCWFEDALSKRIIRIELNRQSVASVILIADTSIILVMFSNIDDNVAEFLLGVDFSLDILQHILSDPYDAMVVANSKAELCYLSPVHEKFFNLKHGEAYGKIVHEVIPHSRLAHVMKTGVPEVGQVLQVGDTQRIVSRHPIYRDGEIVGSIGRVMFKGPEQIEKMARKVSVLEKRLAQYEREASIDKRMDRFLDSIIGQSYAIESVRQQIRKVASLDVPVLIQGESGTGKELVAQALHMCSPRSDARLVTVNAAALPANLVESELFGYEAGAFTGANRKGRPGKFEQADGGTIFLDEIGDMPLDVQSKLLRVLQERVIERVGGDRPKTVDFRLCSATNHNLEELVADDKFRLDLFYRISPVVIRVPSLEERVEDIPLLMRHFLAELSEKYGNHNVDFEPEVFNYLMARQWPGNIRQLRHEIERAYVFAENGKITIESFGHELIKGKPGKLMAPTIETKPSLRGATIKEAVAELELEMISDCMDRFRGNKKKVADHLGISRSYLYKKLEELNYSVEQD